MGVSCERNEASDLTLVGTGRATRLAGTRVVSSRLRVLVSDVESGESAEQTTGDCEQPESGKIFKRQIGVERGSCEGSTPAHGARGRRMVT